MRQTLFYIPTQIAGFPLFGTGILFWVILLAGLFAVIRSLATRKNASDAIFYAVLTALGLLLVRYVGPSLSERDGFPIRGYGVFLTIAIAAAAGVALWRGKRKWNYPTDVLFSVLFLTAIFGIVGARCFYVAQYWHEYQTGNLRDTIFAIINIANGGLVVYGSLIGGTVALIVYLLIKKLPVLATLDLLAPSVMLGVSIGRIGCLMNGCCFGGPCDLPVAISFPPGSPAYMQQLDEGVISLYGITLAQPKSLETSANQDEETIFSLKSRRVNLASDVASDVVVNSVDSGSEAEEAGVKPGDKILEMGLAPSNFLGSEKSAEELYRRGVIRRFRPANNAQVFYFFLNIWNDNPDEDVLLVLQNVSENGNSDASPIRNVIFHPTPAKAKPVHPTQIYSSINAFCIFLILLGVSRFARRDGVVFALMLILYPINRFCLELLRTDEASFCGTGLTVSQCVSVCVILLGITLMIRVCVRPPKLALEGFFSPQTPERVDAANAKDENLVSRDKKSGGNKRRFK